ncbi:MAG: glycerol kinase GlpK [Clostridia bacterium]|nr:glycerol kinase GlpK [Clostridia bacterium]
MKYILSLDQGTTGSRAVLYGEDGKPIAIARREVNQIYPRRGWVEHDAAEIWNNQLDAARAVIRESGISADDILAIGIANQRETAVIWDKGGQPYANAIVWQCRRTSDMCEQLKEEGLEDYIYDRTGLKVDPYFSATKFKWLINNVPAIRSNITGGNVFAGTMDSYLLYRLTGCRVHATDYTNASRTMLFNIHKLDWDCSLMAMFGIPKSILPKVYPSGHLYGYTSPELFGRRIPICGMAGDQQAALFGMLCTRAGDIKSTYGTGCFTLMNTGERNIISGRGLITTLSACVDSRPDYVLEGSVFSSGAVITWLKQGLRAVDDEEECVAIAQSLSDSGGVYLVPAFVGLGAPHWDSEARGTIVGITRGTTREHIVRAAQESAAYQVMDVLRAVQADTGIKIDSLNVDGGLSNNDFVMQFQADISGISVVRPVIKESTSLGAAYLAGLTIGMWNDIEQLRVNKQAEKVFTPDMDKSERSRFILGWEKAVRQTVAK